MHMLCMVDANPEALDRTSYWANGGVSAVGGWLQASMHTQASLRTQAALRTHANGEAACGTCRAWSPLLFSSSTQRFSSPCMAGFARYRLLVRNRVHLYRLFLLNWVLLYSSAFEIVSK